MDESEGSKLNFAKLSEQNGQSAKKQRLREMGKDAVDLGK
jgi:hypothetical protein